jgi:hypothetical protein
MLIERPALLGEVVPAFADRGCRVVSATDSHGRKSRFSRLVERPRHEELEFSFQQRPLSLASSGYRDSLPGENGPGREAGHSLHLVLKLRMHGVYFHSPIHLHGLVLD